MTASAHADDAVSLGQGRRNVIEDMRRITQARQQDQGRAGTAPVEHFQPHIVFDGDERCLMRRWVLPLRLLWRRWHNLRKYDAQSRQKMAIH